MSENMFVLNEMLMALTGRTIDQTIDDYLEASQYTDDDLDLEIRKAIFNNDTHRKDVLIAEQINRSNEL